MRRLAQELRALQGVQGLPLQAAAAILLRHDGDRPDKMRALITGAAAFAFMTLSACSPRLDKLYKFGKNFNCWEPAECARIVWCRPGGHAVLWGLLCV